MRLVYFLSCLSVLALAGCSPGVGSISGKVTYQDKPLTGGKVTFLTSDQKVKTGLIQSDGSYTVDKVTLGPAKVAVDPPFTPPPIMGGMKMDPTKMGAPAGAAPAAPANSKPVALPPKYQDPEKSGLTYTVLKGKQEHNIELK